MSFFISSKEVIWFLIKKISLAEMMYLMMSTLTCWNLFLSRALKLLLKIYKRYSFAKLKGKVQAIF